MERITLSVSPEKMDAVKETLEKAITPDIQIETAIVIYGPADETMKLTLLAMANGASTFSKD